MITLPRVHIDSATGDILFMHWDHDYNGWMPHMPTMEGWQHDQIRLYRTSPLMWITMPGIQRWTLLRRDEEVDIKAVLDYPWISPRQVLTNIPEEVLPEFDAVLEDRRIYDDDSPHSNHPLLGLLEGLPPMGVPAPRQFYVVPRPSAPPDQATLDAATTLQSLRTEPPPPPYTGPGLQPQRQSGCLTTALPIHVANMVIAQACANQMRCPITMELLVPQAAAVTTCGHVFDATAIKEWIRDHRACPTCRQPCGL
jgi:hypothetical protein